MHSCVILRALHLTFLPRHASSWIILRALLLHTLLGYPLSPCVSPFCEVVLTTFDHRTHFTC
ncbi:hypothetical protein GLYMA_18G112650v4 [Glycine max]|nr:hypothetical protein GLYMA_18G112650v4 [Glycine max]KAH1154108.1 hypothetical protein GYH30_049652 [Glycine max]